MDRAELYRDIAARTQGDIYIGVVGPVRTGKSTFIKRFSELLMLPNISNEYVKARLIDELPQSGAGKSIMTTQPRFVPNEAVRVKLDEGTECGIRLVDCVGYLIEGAIGHLENNSQRMVTTPWFTHDIPFEEAARIGTRKVIEEHSTIGVVMTTDGSITELPRERYISAETEVIRRVTETGKPFVIVVNSTDPEGEKAQAVVEEIHRSTGIRPIALDVLHLGERDLTELLTEMLYAFPLKLVELRLPQYMRALKPDHPLIQRLLLPIYGSCSALSCMRDYSTLCDELSNIEQFSRPALVALTPGDGTVSLSVQPDDELFYEVLSSTCGCEIHDDFELMSMISEFSEAKREYDRISSALEKAKSTGYGIVPPSLDEMELIDPEISRQGSGYGVRLRARASGMHLIRVDMDTEVNPLVGSEQQSEALVKYLSDTFEADPAAIWQTTIFGKSLYELVCEGMQGKVFGMPELVQQRMQGTIERIVNDGCNGLICIML